MAQTGNNNRGMNNGVQMSGAPVGHAGAVKFRKRHDPWGLFLFTAALALLTVFAVAAHILPEKVLTFANKMQFITEDIESEYTAPAAAFVRVSGALLAASIYAGIFYKKYKNGRGSAFLLVLSVILMPVLTIFLQHFWIVACAVSAFVLAFVGRFSKDFTFKNKGCRKGEKLYHFLVFAWIALWTFWWWKVQDSLMGSDWVEETGYKIALTAAGAIASWILIDAIGCEAYKRADSTLPAFLAFSLVPVGFAMMIGLVVLAIVGFIIYAVGAGNYEEDKGLTDEQFREKYNPPAGYITDEYGKEHPVWYHDWEVNEVYDENGRTYQLADDKHVYLDR